MHTRNHLPKYTQQDGSKRIMDDLYFAAIDWDALLRREITPPWAPEVQHGLDVSNFNTKYTRSEVDDAPVPMPDGDVLKDETFDDWSFNTDMLGSGAAAPPKPPSAVSS